MNVVVAGNGVIALQTARRIVRERSDVRVTIVGPRARGGSASLAAAAMFNSFCEVDAGTFESAFERWMKTPANPAVSSSDAGISPSSSRLRALT